MQTETRISNIGKARMLARAENDKRNFVAKYGYIDISKITVGTVLVCMDGKTFRVDKIEDGIYYEVPENPIFGSKSMLSEVLEISRTWRIKN